MKLLRQLAIILILTVFGLCPAARAYAAEAAPDYATEIAPILNKYCAGCHNADDKEGGLALDSFALLQQGGKRGPAVLPGDSKSSRLVRLLSGKAEPKMPPEDHEAPTPDELALLAAWIDSGAKGPEGAEPDRRTLVTPEIKPAAPVHRAIAAVAYSPDGKLLAVAKFGVVELVTPDDLKVVRALEHPGKVNSVEFSADGLQLATATGVVGLYGEARLWNLADGTLMKTFAGHRDTLYAARLGADGSLLATAGYDRQIKLWDTVSGKELRTLTGHNDAIYDLAFSPDGKLLASASGDETGKIWHVESGRRLDTLSQPLAEQYAVAISPDGRLVLAGGVDNRIRVWELISREDQRINPILFARFAHEGAIVRMVFSADGKLLATSAEDRTIKLWETESYTQLHVYPAQSDVAPALAIAPGGKHLAVGRMDGSLEIYPIDVKGTAASDAPTEFAAASSEDLPAETNKLTEQEPNDTPQAAMTIAVPAAVTGSIHAMGDASRDTDCFRFTAKAGQKWIIQVNAARNGSPLDSNVAVLDAEGRPIARVLLRAVRDSYLTFRGVDSNNRQFRLHNWEEMELNQYLYTGGEVTRLYLYPRGPDSGFEMYSLGGNRITYFDTTAMSHALHENCYIVEPYAPGAEPPPNGLPVFPIYYENDDDSLRQLGSDSRLAFTAPADGEYVVRLTDVRGFEGEKYTYQLDVRPARPDFAVKLNGANPTVSVGSGQEFTVSVDRVDGFDDEIRVDISGLPPGFCATSPLVIEQGHSIARGAINALASARQPTPEEAKASQVTATAMINGREVTKEINNFGEIKLTGPPKFWVELSPVGQDPPPHPTRSWEPLTPENVTSEAGTKLAVLEDDSVLAGGENPENDSYQIVVETPLEAVAAIRIEALGHESLPAGAPGRVKDNGNFVMSEFLVTAASLKKPDDAKPIEIRRVWSYYSQPNWDVAGLIDGNQETGWAVAEEDKDKKYPVKKFGGDSPHQATFELAKPIGFSGGTRLVFTIDQKSAQKHHNLGRIRLLATGDAEPPLAIPGPPEVAIAPGETLTVRLRVVRNSFDGRVPFESLELNLPHGVIVDNVGLNGVLIPEGQTERTVFLTAADWVPETSRPFYFKAREAEDQTSWPMILHIRRSGELVDAK